jgi:translation elongation factor EF-Ts
MAKEAVNVQYIFDYGLLPGFTPTFYKIQILLKNGTNRSVVAPYYTKYGTDWFLKARARLNLPEFYNGEVVLVENIMKIDLKDLSNEKVFFHLYSNVNGKTKFHHAYDYTLAKEETPDMAKYTMQRLHPNYYIIPVLKSKEDMDKRQIALIKTLRQQTNAAMKHCNEAIKQASADNPNLGDDKILAKATIFLNKKKQIVAAKRSTNKVSQFIIKTAKNPIVDRCVLVKFGCESEQGLKMLRKDYDDVLERIIEVANENATEYIADLMVAEIDDEKIIEQVLTEISGTLNEKVTIVGIENAYMDSPAPPNTRIKEYIHTNAGVDTAGSAIIYNTKKETTKEQEELIAKINHQLTFTNPLFIKKNQYLDYIDKVEGEAIKARILNDNKLFTELTAKKADKTITPEEKEILKGLKKTDEKFIEKKILGALSKFKKDNIFEEQEFLYDDPEVYKAAEDEFLKKNPLPDYDTLYIFPTIDPKLYEVTEQLAVSPEQLSESYDALEESVKEKITVEDFVKQGLEEAKKIQDASPEWNELLTLQNKMNDLSDKKTKHILKYNTQKSTFINNKLKAARTTIGKFLESKGITIFDAVSF